MDRRALLGALAGVGVAATAGCAGVSHPLPPSQGVVRRQSIVGRGDEGGRRLFDLSAAGLRVPSAELGDSLPRDGERANVTVAASVADRLDAAHETVEYLVAVRPLDPRGPLIAAATGKSDAGANGSADAAEAPRRYAVGRPTFNNVLVGDRIEFTVDPTRPSRIGGLIAVVRAGTVRATRRAAADPAIVCAHEGVGRRAYAVGERLPAVEVGERYRFRVGTSYEGRPTLASIVRSEELPAFGEVN